MAIKLKTSEGIVKAVLTEDEILALFDAHAKKELQNAHKDVLGSDDVAGHVYLTSRITPQPLGITAQPVAEGVYKEGEPRKAADATHVHPLPTIHDIDIVSDNVFEKHLAKQASEAIDEPEELIEKARGHVRLTDKFQLEEGETLETVPEFADDVALRARTAARLISFYDEKLAALGKGIRYYRSFHFGVVRSGSRTDERYSPKVVAEKAGWTSEDEFMYLIDFSDLSTFNYYRARRTDETWEQAGTILTVEQEVPQEGTQIGVSEFFLDLRIDDVLSDALCFPGFAVWSADTSNWDYFPDKTGVADNVSIVKTQTGQLSVKTIAATQSTPDRNDFETPSRERNYVSWITDFFRKIRGLRADVTDHASKISTLQDELGEETQNRENAISELNDRLTLEIAARETGDTDLGRRITTEVQRLNEVDESLRGDIEEERTAREEADNSLQQQITDEIDARTQADTALRQQHDKDQQANTKAHTDLTNAIKAEVERAKGVEGDLDALKDTTAANLVDAINKEQDRATAAEDALTRRFDEYEGKSEELHNSLEAKIEAETTRATTREDAIEEAYRKADSDEATTRQKADSALSDRISSNKSTIDELIQALATETSNRQSEDRAIRNDLATETQNRQAADGDFTELQTVEPHDNLVDAINDEIARAKSTEGDLSALSTQSKTDLVSAINEEIGRAKGAEESLQSSIDNEAATRLAKDNELSSRIDSLTSDVDSKELALTQLIEAETARATEREEELQTAVDDERTRARGVEGSLSSLNESLSPASNLVDAINKETARATAQENDLDARLKAEIARATGTEGVLDDLKTRDKTNLVAAINEEIDRAKDQEGVLRSQITNEVNRAQQIEENLTTALNEEISRAATKENELSSAITAEEDRATSAESSLRSSLEQEIQDRQDADNSLARQIEGLKGSSQQTVADIEEKVEEEINRSTQEDLRISGLLSQEISDRQAADTEITSALDSEIARAEAAEKSLTEGKRDIISTQTSVIYSVSPTGQQTFLRYSSDVIADAVPQRTASGGITVPDPEERTDAVNKDYVDTVKTSLSNTDNQLQAALTEETKKREDEDIAIREQLSSMDSTVDSKKLNRTGPDTFTGELTIEGNQIVTQSVTVGKDITVSGNLFVKGTTTTVDSVNVQTEDNLLVLNKSGILPVTYGGIAIKVKSSTESNAYGLVYDISSETVKLGIGAVDDAGDFTFSDGEGTALTVREDASMWTQYSLAMWDETLHGFIHSAFATEGATLRTDDPMTLQSSSVTVQSGTDEDVQLNIKGNADVKNITAQDVSSSSVSTDTVKVTTIQSKDGTVSVTMPEENGTMARVEDVQALGETLIDSAQLVVEAI